jgi:hypothetical protein
LLTFGRSNTSSGAWTEIVRRIIEMKERETGKRMFTAISGPEMFGYAPSACTL